MNVKKSAEIVGISCSIFQGELEELRKLGKISIPMIYLDSMLHMFPERLRHEMNDKIAGELAKQHKVILVYGECHAFISDFEPHLDIVRVAGINCVEILLGKDLYRSLRKDGVFFFLPEWTKRWKEVFEDQLGLNAHNAKDFMREMHSKLLYLDTGIVPVPHDTLREIASYTGLAIKVLNTPSDHLLKNINASIEKWNSNGSR